MTRQKAGSSNLDESWFRCHYHTIIANLNSACQNFQSLQILLQILIFSLFGVKDWCHVKSFYYKRYTHRKNSLFKAQKQKWKINTPFLFLFLCWKSVYVYCVYIHRGDVFKSRWWPMLKDFGIDTLQLILTLIFSFFMAFLHLKLLLLMIFVWKTCQIDLRGLA